MATIAENGLFPPIIETYLPAKSLTGAGGDQDDIVIPFDINYNDIIDIKEIHISLTRQTNYHNAYKQVLYPRGVYVTNNITQLSGNIYQTILPFNILNINEVSYNEYYKLQIRLSKDDGGAGKVGEDLSGYLTDENNLAKFSEWSTVCLIRFIAQPNIVLSCNGQSVETGAQASSIITDSTQIMIAGRYNKQTINYDSLAQQKDNEYLHSYRFEVYTTDQQTDQDKVYDSGDILVDRQNPNEINYTLRYYFTSNNYRIYLYYVTANLYQDVIYFNLNVNYSSQTWSENQKVAEAIAVDSVIGKVNITFEPLEGNVSIPAGSKFIIRRGSDIDDFQIWDTMYLKTLTEDIPILSFDDFTIESGILYKYEINFIDPDTDIMYSITEGPVMSIFDHAFLTGEGTQLCVKFNPSIGSYKVNIGQSVITTLGGVYPFIRRNGNMEYKTFTLSGTIAYEMDMQHQFATRSSIYGEWIQVYGSYFVNHYINQQNDRITQRKFRDLVINYLNNDIPKLFRSTPEGNILVKITDLNLTPKNELGRMIYDFSCSAIEIGEPSVDNYKMYKIQDFGDE